MHSLGQKVTCNMIYNLIKSTLLSGGTCTSLLCSARNPCPSRSQTCENGRCVDTCRGKNCGLNAQCDADTSSCVCAEGFVGDPEHFCMPPIGPAVCDPG